MTHANHSNLLTIDGSRGEGGGQILRSSLALSMATGRPFRIVNIRAGRAKPGLMRQHLTCIQAAALVSSAEVDGGVVGSQKVTFVPGKVKAGEYAFAIGTAGSTTLVLQAILPVLIAAEGDSKVTIEGGTHNKSAPSVEFLQKALTPLLNRIGANLQVRLERHGFYPAGGGRIVVDIAQLRALKPLDLLTRGNHLATRACAVVSRLARSIGERELSVLRERLQLEPHHVEASCIDNPIGPGNAAWVEMECDHITEVFAAVGEMGKAAEDVAKEVSDQASAYLTASWPVGPYLADQLMVPLTLLAGGRYATGPLTEHSRTNIAVIGAFGGHIVQDDEGRVQVSPLRSI
ncbi:MAG: RNA 3'-terminal phosphate cyclase [Phycisphaerales bacterium]